MARSRQAIIDKIKASPLLDKLYYEEILANKDILTKYKNIARQKLAELESK